MKNKLIELASVIATFLCVLYFAEKSAEESKPMYSIVSVGFAVVYYFLVYDKGNGEKSDAR